MSDIRFLGFLCLTLVMVSGGVRIGFCDVDPGDVPGKEWDEAEQRLREFIDANPEDPSGRLLLGQYLVKVRRFHEALHSLEKYLELDPDGEHARFLMIEAYMEMGRPVEAQKILDGLEENKETQKDAVAAP